MDMGIWNEKKENLKWDSKNNEYCILNFPFFFLVISYNKFCNHSGTNITEFSVEDLLEIF